MQVCHFLILDLGEPFGSQRYFFYPGWTCDLDCEYYYLNPGRIIEETVLDFILPQPLDPAGPFCFLTALTSFDMTEIVSNIDQVQFSFI